MIYASVGTGFKSGGFQGQLTFNSADLAGFREENLLAYEVGLKSQFADRRVQLNGAIFFYDFEDLQFYGPLFDSPVGPLFGIQNVGDADVSGAEGNWSAYLWGKNLGDERYRTQMSTTSVGLAETCHLWSWFRIRLVASQISKDYGLCDGY